MGQTSLCLCSSGLRDPFPMGRCTSCQALGGHGCCIWSSAQGTANKDAIIRGRGGTSPLPSSVSRQERLFLFRFAADRPGFLLSWLELILEARGPGTARSSSKYTQAAAPPAPSTKQGWLSSGKWATWEAGPPPSPLFFCPSPDRQAGLETPWKKFGTLGIWERLGGRRPASL